MLVMFKKATIFNGPKGKGDIIEVPNDVARRWMRNGIAVAHIIVEETPAASNEPANLSAKELFRECLKIGIEVEAKQTREYYLEKLSQQVVPTEEV